MTGGQSLEGGMTVPMIVNQVLAEGIEKVVVVTDEPHKYPSGFIPRGVPVYHRRQLQSLQKELREVPGVSVLVYDQTCAAEKRRRRKRGLFPDPDKRVFINAAVCEGCGDCGVKSNCVAVVPLETPLGTKRAIDQSACNKDFSCLNGFCPSFVTVHGAKVRKADTTQVADSGIVNMLAGLPEPRLPALDRPFTMLVTGVGGTGVVTLSAVLGQAAHLEGKGFGAIDMTGLAQKGGAVACHMRVAREVAQIHAIRAGVAGADLVLGCDLVVTASNKVLETVKPDHTAIVYSDYEMTTADFTRNANLKVPGAALRHAIEARAGKAPVHALDAHTLAVKLFGDSIAANMFLLGYAYQLGHVPIGSRAIEQAIELNGAAVEMSRNARCGGTGEDARPICARQTQAAGARGAHRRSRRAARRLPGSGSGGALSRADRQRRRSRAPPGAGSQRPHRCGRARLPQAACLQGRIRSGASVHGPGLRSGLV
jgi:indolepyruvate ferredoxin oxidoreductase